MPPLEPWDSSARVCGVGPLGLYDWGSIGVPPSGIPVVEHPSLHGEWSPDGLPGFMVCPCCLLRW